MKQLLLSLILVIMLFSCSSDDAPEPFTLTLTSDLSEVEVDQIIPLQL